MKYPNREDDPSNKKRKIVLPSYAEGNQKELNLPNSNIKNHLYPTLNFSLISPDKFTISIIKGTVHKDVSYCF